MKWLSRLFRRSPSPADNYSPRAQKLLLLARRQADRLHHGYVGTEHLLLGLIEMNEGVGHAALRGLGLKPDNLRAEIEARSVVGRETAIAPNIPLTPAAHKVLVRACDEARRLGHNYVGTEHIFLGLLRLRWGIAPSVLKKQGADLARARATVGEVLSSPSPPAAP